MTKTVEVTCFDLTDGRSESKESNRITNNTKRKAESGGKKKLRH